MTKASNLATNFNHGKNTNTFIILFATVIAAITAMIINGTAYDDNGNLVCTNYILNSYLYVVIGFCIIAMVPILLYNILISGVLDAFRLSNIYVVVIVLLALLAGLLLCIYYINNADPIKDAVAIHVVYVVFCGLFGLVMSGVLILGAATGLLVPAISIVIGLTAIAGYIGYYHGNKFITVDFDKILSYALIALIIWTVVCAFVIDDPVARMYATVIPCVIVFFLLLMSYNNKLRKSAEECKVPNYPKEAVGLVTKIGNLLAGIMRLLRGRRLGRK